MRIKNPAYSHTWKQKPLSALAAARLSHIIELDISCLRTGISRQYIYLYLFEKKSGRFMATTDVVFCQLPFDQLPTDAPLLLEQEPDVRPSEVRFVLESEQATEERAVSDMIEQVQEIFAHTKDQRYQFQCIIGQHQNMTAALDHEQENTLQKIAPVTFKKGRTNAQCRDSVLLLSFHGYRFYLRHNESSVGLIGLTGYKPPRSAPYHTLYVNQHIPKEEYTKDLLLAVENAFLLAYYQFIDNQQWSHNVATMRALHQKKRNIAEMKEFFRKNLELLPNSMLRLVPSLSNPIEVPRFGLYKTVFPEFQSTHTPPMQQEQKTERDSFAWESLDHAGFDVAEMSSVVWVYSRDTRYHVNYIYIYKTVMPANEKYFLQSCVYIMTHPHDSFEECISNDHGFLGTFSTEKEAFDAIEEKVEEKEMILHKYGCDGIRHTVRNTYTPVFLVY